MDSPFRSESSAFRFLLLTIAAFAVIVVAGLIGGGWAAFGAWLVVSGAAAGYYIQLRGSAPPRTQHVPHVGAATARRIVVVIDETVDGEVLAAHVRRHRGGDDDRVLVVAPALTSHGHRWTDDIDGDRRAAEQRLEETVAALSRAGIPAEGSVGSPEPLEATEDAIHLFGADQLVVVTHARTSENWAEKGFVDALRERFDVPVDAIVV